MPLAALLMVTQSRLNHDADHHIHHAESAEQNKDHKKWDHIRLAEVNVADYVITPRIEG